MMTTVTPTVWGYHVAIETPVSERLALAVDCFKEAEPRKCRRYQAEGRYWFVH